MLVKEKAVNYKVEGKVDICSASIVKELMNSIVQLNILGEEHLYMLALNRTKLLGIFLISKGTVCQTCLSPREIFMRALMVGASCIVICHNHPSQNITPSSEDIAESQ